jgi:uncharacterized UBP type Zn finger protein
MTCTHLDQINEDIEITATGCEECQKKGGWWTRLRVCLICGHVGCCDDSPGKHASAHFKETGHPIMASFEEGQDAMRWCYVDEEVV